MLILRIAVAVLGSIAFIDWLIDRVFSAPRYHGPVTDHVNCKMFLNLDAPERKGFLDFVRWQLTSKRGYWNKWTDNGPRTLPPARLNGRNLRVTFINHATVLIQTEGLNILTDPIWSERASPVTWAGPKRHRPPGLRFEDLPPIDLVLIGHNHYDHLDIKTLLRLFAEHRPRFVTALGNRALLSNHEIDDVIELDWWHSAQVSEELRVTCVPAKHFSGRGLSDGEATLWCGYVIEAPAGNIY